MLPAIKFQYVNNLINRIIDSNVVTKRLNMNLVRQMTFFLYSFYAILHLLYTNILLINLFSFFYFLTDQLHFGSHSFIHLFVDFYRVYIATTRKPSTSERK